MRLASELLANLGQNEQPELYAAAKAISITSIAI